MKSPNVLPIICSAEKGRGCKKKNISFWKINASFQKVETFRFADYTSVADEKAAKQYIGR